MEQYLQQILDELRAIRRLLEQGGGKLVASSTATTKQNVQSSSVVPQSFSLRTHSAGKYLGCYLKERNLVILEAEDIDTNESEKREYFQVAHLIGQYYDVSREMLDALRRAFQSSEAVEIDAKKFNSEEKNKIAVICDKLRKLGILEVFDRVRTGRRVSKFTCKVRGLPHDYSYLLGGWFELYVAQEVRRILAGKAPLVLRGVKLMELQDFPSNHFEIDVLFVVQSKTGYSVGVIECKSGKNVNTSQVRQQIWNITSMLQLRTQQTAVVMPNSPSETRRQNCLEQIGVQCFGLSELNEFLRGMVQ